MPAKNRYVLANANIFILPSKFGVSFLGFCLLLFILGTNYQNNLIVLFSYLLVSFFVTSMLTCFFNLYRLEVIQSEIAKGFAEKNINLPITIKTQKDRHDLHFEYLDNSPRIEKYIGIGSFQTSIPVYFETRGRKKLKRIKISTNYAFGLFTAWTQLDLNCEVIVYPVPIEVSESGGAHHVKPEYVEDNLPSATNIVSGTDDFHALSPYKTGEPLAHVSWKHLAKTGTWQTKHYTDSESRQVWLSLNEMPSNRLETKLSMLCYLILEYEKHGEAFGVNLNGQIIEPHNGSEHIEHCLASLAVYNKREL